MVQQAGGTENFFAAQAMCPRLTDDGGRDTFWTWFGGAPEVRRDDQEREIEACGQAVWWMGHVAAAPPTECKNPESDY